MSEQKAPVAGARWVRERGGGGIGKWHRPTVWPTPPGDLIATMCGREVMADCSANVSGGGTPHPACTDCAP